MSRPPSPEDGELIARFKAHAKRRLQQRWGCRVQGHTRCYKDTNGACVQMSDDAIDMWANGWSRGETTMFVPPRSVYTPPGYSSSDTHSTASFVTARSRISTIEYQRPVGFRGAFRSLTDLRSARNNFAASSASLSASRSSSSFTMPGIGYDSGIAIEWLGDRILGAVEAFIIRRRLRLARRLERQLCDVIPDGAYPSWMERNSRKLHRCAIELLELSSGRYKGKLKRDAELLAGAFEDHFTIIAYSSAPDPYEDWLNIRQVSIASDCGSDTDIRFKLREACLQENTGKMSVESAFDITNILCSELAYAPFSTWVPEGYYLLRLLVIHQPGKEALLALEKTGTLLFDLAGRLFVREDSTANGEDTRHTFCRGFFFFSTYAAYSQCFSAYLDGEHGIIRLSNMLKDERERRWSDIDRIHDIFAGFYTYSCLPARAERLADVLDPSLVVSALKALLSASIGMIPSHGRSSYLHWVSILQVLVSVGRQSTSFSSAVSGEMSDELQSLLIQKIFHQKQQFGVPIAREPLELVRVLWPQHAVTIDDELTSLGFKIGDL